MMVKVNLLPPEIAERARARRITAATVALVTVWVLLLGGLYGLKLGDVAEAQQARDAAQADVTALQSEVAALQEFRELAQQLDARNALLASAMANEVSWARVLNDLSLAFPANSSLLSLNVLTEATQAEDAPLVEGEPDFGQRIASMTFTGYSVERYVPGIASVLTDFETARGFFNSYLQTASEREIGTTEVTEFNGAVRLNADAYTKRYEDGLPREVGK